jgi:hypothetical protein
MEMRFGTGILKFEDCNIKGADILLANKLVYLSLPSILLIPVVVHCIKAALQQKYFHYT